MLVSNDFENFTVIRKGSTLNNCLSLEPNREVTIKDLRPNMQYFIRLRANDKLGPGRLSNPVSINTRRPGQWENCVHSNSK